MGLPSGIEPEMQAAALSETGNKRGGIGCAEFRLKQKGEINRVFWNILRRNYYTIFLVKLLLAIKPEL